MVMKPASLCLEGGAGDQKKHSIDLWLKKENGPGEKVSDLLIEQGLAKRTEGEDIVEGGAKFPFQGFPCPGAELQKAVKEF